MAWIAELLPPRFTGAVKKWTLIKRIKEFHNLPLIGVRLRTLYLNHSFWAFADQGLVSLGTFATNIILARTLSPEDYGRYVIIFGVLLFLNSIQYAIITFPLTVRGAASDQNSLRHLAISSLLFTTILALFLGVGMLGAATILGSIQLAPWAVSSLFFWQFQEVFRRALMAHQRYFEVMWGDALSYLGQALLMLVLYWYGQLSAQSTFAVIALTSAIAGAVQAIQLGLTSIKFSQVWRVVDDFWRLGSWLLLHNLISNFFTFLSFPWALAYLYGVNEAAALQAVLNIIGASHPIIFCMRGLIVPATARSYRAAGKAAAQRITFNYAIQGLILLFPFYAIVLLWPRMLLTAFYGMDSPYLGLEAPLRLFVPAYTLFYMSVILTSFIDGLEETRRALMAQLVSACAFLIIGLPLTAWGGVIGASLGRSVYGLTVVIACVVIIRKIK